MASQLPVILRLGLDDELGVPTDRRSVAPSPDEFHPLGNGMGVWRVRWRLLHFPHPYSAREIVDPENVDFILRIAVLDKPVLQTLPFGDYERLGEAIFPAARRIDHRHFAHGSASF